MAGRQVRRQVRRHVRRQVRRRTARSLIGGVIGWVIGCAVVTGALIAGGAASGVWMGFGDGIGAAATQTPVALTLSPGTPAALLYPGGSADVVLTLSNPNSAAVHIGSLALDPAQGAGGFATDAGHAGCGTGTLTFATATNAGAGWTVPGAVGGTPGALATTLTGALSMSLAAADQCQGAGFTVFLTAGP
jgi:hypothetical protein